MRLVLLEPCALAGATWDLGFGASPSALAPGVRAETLPGGAREFHLEVRLGRAAPRGDRAAGSAGAEVGLDAAGVSRHHATLTLSCGDERP